MKAEEEEKKTQIYIRMFKHLISNQRKLAFERFVTFISISSILLISSLKLK